MNEKGLLVLKEKIDKAKTKQAELQGTQKHLMNELKKDWGCNTIKEAEEKANNFEKDIEKLNKTIQEGCKELEERHILLGNNKDQIAEFYKTHPISKKY